MSLRQRARAGLLGVLRAVTGRHPLLLPPEADGSEPMLLVRAPYRVEGSRLDVAIDEPDAGDLSLELVAYDGHFPRIRLWEARGRYGGPCRLSLDLATGAVTLGDTPLGRAPMPIPSRRFCWRLGLDGPSGMRRRLTGHYQSAGVGSYYQGGHYVDYEAEARSEVAAVLELFARHDAKGPVLEAGCATGLVLEALARAGHDVCGLDHSTWAIEQAGARVDPSRLAACDVERDGVPDALAARGPFRTLLLWAVLEHFHDPFRVLEALSAHLDEGGTLIVNTTNADSLNRWLFGRDWEGYADPTHHGVDAVSVASLRERLPALGLRIVELTTRLSWDSSADPTHATMREWWAADARFRRLLEERDRGDLLVCVAVKA